MLLSWLNTHHGGKRAAKENSAASQSDVKTRTREAEWGSRRLNTKFIYIFQLLITSNGRGWPQNYVQKSTLNLGFINDLFPGEKPEKINTGLTYIQKLSKKQDQNVKKFLFEEGTSRRF